MRTEGAVQGLISAVVRVDPGTEIYVNSHAKYRPWFRFGSGKWARALYRVILKSTRNRTFLLFAIPSTPGSHVPILVGMSHLGLNGAITDL